MSRFLTKGCLATLLGVGAALALTSAASAKDLVIGVSWSNFQEERWKTDEAAMKSVIEADGRQVHQCRRPKLQRKADRRYREPDHARRQVR